MKLLLICFLYAMILSGAWIHMGQAGKHSLPLKSIKKDTVQFELQVMPIFARRCSPCHFTGGVMYARMPFDKAETILSHQTGILKRIKDEKEVSLIQAFVGQARN